MSWELGEPGASVRVLTAVTGPHEGSVAELLAAHAPQVAVARRCADSAELLATAHVGLGTVAVVSSDLPGLDRNLVQMLARDRVGLIILNDPLDQFNAQRLGALGITEALTHTDIPGYLIDSIMRAHAKVMGGRSGTGTGIGTGGDRPAGQRPDGQSPDRTSVHADNRANEFGAGSLGAVPPAPGTLPSGPGPDPVGYEPLANLPGFEVDPPSLNASLDSTPPRDGKIITVWGSAGAPGRTTIAASLAYALGHNLAGSKKAGSKKAGAKNLAAQKSAAQQAGSTLLIDADTYAPSMNQVLGLLNEGSGLAQACHTAGQGLLTADNLSQSLVRVTDHVFVLTGLPRVTRWPEVPGFNLEAVLHHARASHDWLVTDCAAPTEQDELLSFDTRAPQRNGATLAAVAASDLVIVVGRGDPVGIKRLADSLAEARENPAFLNAHVVVVVNQMRAQSAGPKGREAIIEALRRYCSVENLVFVPHDAGLMDRALMAGRTPVEVAPGSAVAKAIVSLARLVREHPAIAPTAHVGA